LSITDVVWLLPALAGVAIAILLPSRLLALMLGPALMIVFVYTLGWSLSNHECEAGQSCTTAERVLELVNPMLLTLAPALFVAALARYLWFWWRSWRAWHHQTKKSNHNDGIVWRPGCGGLFGQVVECACERVGRSCCTAGLHDRRCDAGEPAGDARRGPAWY
jgi:hypothetical protein